ncbi:hypothetical protein [Streptomyces sp. NPDC007346]|uniref:hypothetical protein n=1 Tax=Streptomyces sp. NPDC007346 TaxID=3154682 RepID=UPI00345570B6
MPVTPPLPRTTRQVALASVPQGLPTAAHFAVAEAPLPAPAPGQVLVRNRFLLVFPGPRTLLGAEIDRLTRLRADLTRRVYGEP